MTGSRYLLDTDDARLLVDCGLFQGFKHLRKRNWEPFPVDPTSIDAVILTHGHIDHTGYLPLLIKSGFSGPVYATPGTRDLCGVILPDSGRLQEEDAEHANRRGSSKHQPALPLYTEEDANRAVEAIEAVPFHHDLALPGNAHFHYQRAGHILGAASVWLEAEGTSVLFSGDLGRPHDALMPPPDPPGAPDYVVVESTYGNRRHGHDDQSDKLAEIINRTAKRGGVVLIPAFAVGRSQSVLYELSRLEEAKRIQPLPIYLDSPMAVNTTSLYDAHPDDHRLSTQALREMESRTTFIRSVDESKQLNELAGPAVIVSASGMLSGGRVLHHLAAHGPDPNSTLVFVGYQAAGTRGSQILHGEREVRIYGSMVPIRCEVESLSGFSAHADSDEIIAWLADMEQAPRRVFITHGEPDAAEALRKRISYELMWECEVPTMGEVTTLTEPGGVGDALASLPLDQRKRIEAIINDPSFQRADRDDALLARDELRGTRLMLEFLKVEFALRDRGISETVVVVGSARIRPDDRSTEGLSRFYEEAREFGRLAGSEAVDGGHRLVVTTGGGPGIMEAANRGAAEVGAPTIGLNITLPHEQVPNPYLTPGLAFDFRYFALRKLHFLLRARAMVAFPGGFGTLDELTDALTLIQTGRMEPIPLVLVGEDYWGQTLGIDYLARMGLIGSGDPNLVTVVDSGTEAWGVIKERYPGSTNSKPPVTPEL